MSERVRDYRYMMAMHGGSDVGKPAESPCIVYSEDEKGFWGEWIPNGMASRVLFPKETTRGCTPKEESEAIELCRLQEQ